MASAVQGCFLKYVTSIDFREEKAKKMSSSTVTKMKIKTWKDS